MLTYRQIKVPSLWMCIRRSVWQVRFFLRTYESSSLISDMIAVGTNTGNVEIYQKDGTHSSLYIPFFLFLKKFSLQITSLIAILRFKQTHWKFYFKVQCSALPHKTKYWCTTNVGCDRKYFNHNQFIYALLFILNNIFVNLTSCLETIGVAKVEINVVKFSPNGKFDIIYLPCPHIYSLSHIKLEHQSLIWSGKYG